MKYKEDVKEKKNMCAGYVCFVVVTVVESVGWFCFCIPSLHFYSALPKLNAISTYLLPLFAHRFHSLAFAIGTKERKKEKIKMWVFYELQSAIETQTALFYLLLLCIFLRCIPFEMNVSIRQTQRCVNQSHVPTNWSLILDRILEEKKCAHFRLIFFFTHRHTHCSLSIHRFCSHGSKCG